MREVGQVLIGEARAQMQARATGWWWNALANLRKASRLDVAGRDPVELRELAIQCMGSQYPCLRLAGTWTGHRGPVLSVAVSPDGHSAVSGSVDGTVRLWRLPEGRPLAARNLSRVGAVRSRTRAIGRCGCVR